MLKSLADRLAEACAEWLHAQVRRDYWGYAGRGARQRRADPRGISRHPPGAGLPGLPDHTAKGPLFALLDAPANAGMGITESFAMTRPPPFPASSWRTRRHYFAVRRSAATRWKTGRRQGPVQQ